MYAAACNIPGVCVVALTKKLALRRCSEFLITLLAIGSLDFLDLLSWLFR